MSVLWKNWITAFKVKVTVKVQKGGGGCFLLHKAANLLFNSLLVSVSAVFSIFSEERIHLLRGLNCVIMASIPQ